mmetsp:Transcript_49592/g.128055  ORF Transcript_49592/g.128055 Transcript_49592/m.128055 type:complete len:204 (+) Transcript_49592:717-1328(+)
MSQCFAGAETGSRVHNKQLAHEAPQRERRRLPAWAPKERVACEHRILVHTAQNVHVRGLKWEVTRYQQEQHDAGTPDIAHAVVEGIKDLWCCEEKRPSHRMHRRLKRGRLGRAEVQELQACGTHILEAEVLRLDITVHHAYCVHSSEGAKHLRCQAPCGVRADISTGCLHVAEQVGPFTAVHDDVQHVWSLDKLSVLHDVLVV